MRCGSRHCARPSNGLFCPRFIARPSKRACIRCIVPVEKQSDHNRDNADNPPSPVLFLALPLILRRALQFRLPIWDCKLLEQRFLQLEPTKHQTRPSVCLTPGVAPLSALFRSDAAGDAALSAALDVETPTAVGSENSDPFHSGNSEPSGNSRKG